MGLFSHFFHSSSNEEKGDITLFAPMSGTLIPITDVPDVVISEKVVGDGVAIFPESEEVVAPCTGEITRILASNSAFTIKEEHGIEIYVSFGIAAYELCGEGFSSLVEIGDKVELGTPILKVDYSKVSSKIKSLVSAMIVVNSSGTIKKVTSAQGKCEAGKTPITWILLEN